MKGIYYPKQRNLKYTEGSKGNKRKFIQEKRE